MVPLSFTLQDGKILDLCIPATYTVNLEIFAYYLIRKFRRCY